MSSSWPELEQGSGFKIDTLQDVSPSFLGDLGAYLEQNPPRLPINQLMGYSQITPYTASVTAEETTGSVTYTNLTTVGPTLTSLPDGTYSVQWGAAAKTSTTNDRVRMTVSPNGAVVPSADPKQAYTLSAQSVGVMFSTSFVLNQGSGGNTLTCQYSVGVSGTTGTWGGRWLTAVRISGP